ncbi:MAG: hypothetical protein SOZ59_16145 [Candidatus Limivivens sp.]|nr:hypothetical protein [Candidatus Limivivens sp.]
MEDGPLAFQVEDEEVKAALDRFPEGTSFTFEAAQTAEGRKITKILGE